MQTFLLLRNNIESGPYSGEELKQAGIWSTDLIWIEGKSREWQRPDKIEEIKSFVYDSHKSLDDNPVSNFNLPIFQQDGQIPNMRVNNSATISPLPIPPPSKSKQEKEEQTDTVPEEKYKPVDITEQVSRRSLEIRKSLLLGRDSSESFPNPDPENRKDELDKTQNGSNAIKVIIADDHRLFREGVKMALSQKKDISIIAEAENGIQLMQLLKFNKPDVVLLDIQMPLLDGISALNSIRKHYGNLKVIMLTMHEGHSMVSALMEKGANAYLTKTADPETIYQAIKTCFTKDFYFNELTNISMLEGLRSKNRIPERTASPIFDGARLMQQLTEAQKKTAKHYSRKTRSRLMFTGFSLLLVAAGITVGRTILGSSQNMKQTLADKPAKHAARIPAQAHTATKINPEPTPQEIVQKKDAEDPPLSENTVTELSNKKISTQKHNLIKTANLQILPKVQELRKVDTTAKTSPEEGVSKTLNPADETREIARNNIRLLVTASVNNYHKGLFGGLSDIQLTVNNQSAYKLEEVTVEIKYLHGDLTPYKTESLNFQNIEPSSNQVLEAPKSSKGVKIEYRILSIKSSELGI